MMYGSGNDYNGNDRNGSDDLFNFPQYSGGYGVQPPPRRPQPSNEQLMKSNRNFKILCIVLSALLVLCFAATMITCLYFSRNRAKDTTSNANELSNVVAYNTIYSVAAVTSVGSSSSKGSGFVVHSSISGTYIMTNRHVIENSLQSTVSGDRQTGTITVAMHASPTGISASIAAVSKEYDFAVLKLSALSAATYPAVSFGDSDNLDYGDYVLAIGNALGYGLSVTDGIVSVPKTTISDNNRNVEVVQTNAAINQGNSGGPLFDKNSRVIGINTYKKTVSQSGTTVEGIGYAIPSEAIVSFINSANLGFTVEYAKD